jgi:membrane associated rhomboid family serine protease
MYSDRSSERATAHEETDQPVSAQPPPPSSRVAPRTLVVWAITAVNVVVWLAMEASGGSTNTRTLILFGAKVNPLIADGQYWRLVTAIFIHIGLMHLIFNSVALLSFGRLAEAIYGHWRFLGIYLVSGIAGTTFSYLLTRGVSAGASGAIFGVAGALGIFFAMNRGKGPLAGQGQLGSIVALLVINGVFGVVNPMIDNWAHAGGLIAGAALAAWLTPRFEPIVTPEGARIGWRLRGSSTASWTIAPLVLVILAVAVLRIPPR